MVAAYDNWGRLTAAVLRREELWQLFHAPSRTSSLSSTASSDLSTTSSLRSSKRFDSSTHLPSTIGYIGGIKVDKSNSHFVCIENSRTQFDIDDLLDAPWESIGEEFNSFRTMFTAALSNGTTILLKKLRIGRVAHDVFDERILTVRSIDHENVAALRGYVFVEDGVVGLFDYFNKGSLFAMLHGNRSHNQVHLDWETRTRIAVGTARGLAHIHSQCDGTLVHGNIKASNVFLNSEQYGCLADYDLASLINPEVKPVRRNPGYRAPEAGHKPSQASDVYSFGILLIELLTGRSPTHTGRSHESFSDWARFHVRDGLSFWVYDMELLRNPVVKQAMWNMLEIAIPCIAKKPENRPKMSDVVEILELLFVSKLLPAE